MKYIHFIQNHNGKNEYSPHLSFFSAVWTRTRWAHNKCSTMLTINIQDGAETLFPSYYLFQVRLCLKIQFAEDDDPSEHREDNGSQQFNYLKTRESIYKEAAVRSYPAKRENSSCSRCGQKCLFNLLPSNCGLRKSVYSRGLQCNHTANCRVEPLFFIKQMKGDEKATSV